MSHSVQRELFNDTEISINEIDLQTAMPIYNLKAPHSTGPDGIPGKFIKRFASYLSKPLLHLFNLSISACSIPSIWKSSYLKPIFKKGNRGDIKNYRSVCILSAIPKILRKIISTKLSRKLNLIVFEKQPGFKEKKSTISN